MLLIGLIVAVSFIAAIIAYKTSYWDKWENAIGTFIFLIVIGAVIGFLTSYFVSLETLKETKVTFPVKIVSLRDGSQVEGKIGGNLFLMRGYIGEKEYFTYYQDNGNGSYSLGKRPAGQSTIWTDVTPETARIDVTDIHRECTYDSLWMYPFVCALDSQTPPVEFHWADFHVPEGSIKQDFVLDAQ